MKKILTAIFMAAAMSANAQMYIGGTVGFESSKDKGATAVNNFTIMPELGYKLDEQLTLGIELGYKHEGNMANSLVPATSRIKGNTFKIAPYARYTFITVGDFRGFVDGKLSFSTTGMTAVTNNGTTTTEADINDNLNSFGITLEPGVAYDVTDNVTVVCKTVNLLGFRHNWFGDATNNTFGIGASSVGISFGAYYNF